MHISEGVLRPEILVPAAIVATLTVVYLTYKLKFSQIPLVASLSAMFFVASFIHIPLGTTSIHLILSGLVGAFLGANAILAIFVALLLQALIFNFGGIAVLGVNLIIIAFPAILGRFFVKLSFKKWRKFCYFLVGFTPILISALLLSLTLLLNGDEFIFASSVALIANIALMVIEGIISQIALLFIWRVNGEILR